MRAVHSKKGSSGPATIGHGLKQASSDDGGTVGMAEAVINDDHFLLNELAEGLCRLVLASLSVCDDVMTGRGHLFTRQLRIGVDRSTHRALPAPAGPGEHIPGDSAVVGHGRPVARYLTATRRILLYHAW